MRRLFIAFCQLGLFLTTLTVTVVLVIKLESYRYIRPPKELPLHAQTALVLGAGILSNGKMSPIFKDRIDIAVTLYRTQQVRTILVSGDDGTDEHNEVNPAREYLLQQGVPSTDIFLDHAGFDTYSSMYRARAVFLVTSAVIVTQPFHLPRSVFIARRLGIEAYGTPADQHAYHIKNNVREVLASVKAFFNVVYNRKPEYLGPQIPITGSGNSSI